MIGTCYLLVLSNFTQKGVLVHMFKYFILAIYSQPLLIVIIYYYLLLPFKSEPLLPLTFELLTHFTALTLGSWCSHNYLCNQFCIDSVIRVLNCWSTL